MKKYNINIRFEAANDQQAQKLANLVQHTLKKNAQTDIIALLEKAAKNPSLIKTALRLI